LYTVDIFPGIQILYVHWCTYTSHDPNILTKYFLFYEKLEISHIKEAFYVLSKSNCLNSDIREDKILKIKVKQTLI
jgi:hypothetical protein